MYHPKSFSQMEKNPKYPNIKNLDTKTTHISEASYWNYTMITQHPAYSNNLVTIST